MSYRIVDLQVCHYPDCDSLPQHICEECLELFCTHHSYWSPEDSRYHCRMCNESKPTPTQAIPENKGKKHQSAVGPTKRIHVRFTDKFYDGPVYVREVIQEKVLTERAVYVLEGGAILETPHGDVYLTKEQYEYMFEEV